MARAFAVRTLMRLPFDDDDIPGHIKRKEKFWGKRLVPHNSKAAET
jgi:hypothetical protein